MSDDPWYQESVSMPTWLFYLSLVGCNLIGFFLGVVGS